MTEISPADSEETCGHTSNLRERELAAEVEKHDSHGHFEDGLEQFHMPFRRQFSTGTNEQTSSK
ncbi:MAG: hypothetical protein R3B91_11385 [Planctomycetaceae bacterium]